MTFAYAVFCVADATAQPYPNRAIRFIIPFAPGGGGDMVGRVVGQKLAEQIGQNVVIDNRGGAGGNIGTELGARSKPDGYTLVLGNVGPLAVSPTLYPNLTFDPMKDLTPITMIASFPNLLVVHPSLPAKSVRELVTIARARPGELSYASAGNGTATHLAGELFKFMAAINIIHVPYKGGAAALTDVISGQVSFYFGTVPSALPLARAGRLRALAVTTQKRSAVLPDTPTVGESGFPGFETSSWYGLMVPAGTPRDINQRLHAEMMKVLASTDVKNRFAQEGSEPSPGTSEQFTEWIRSENTKWSKIVKASRAKID